MGQVLHGSATTTEAVRRAIQHSQESLRSAGQALRDQSKDRRQVEGADVRFRPADRTEGAQINGPVRRGGGGRRRLPKAYAAAARRLPLRPAADDPASDALVAASLPQAPRDLPAAAGRRRSFAQAQVQGLSDRLFSYRHRRGSNRAGQALPHRRDRPDVEVRLRRVAREGGASHRRRLPAPPDRRRPLQGPHRPHRQRNPLHHARQYEFGRRPTSRPPSTPGSLSGRTPSNTPAPRTISIIA